MDMMDVSSHTLEAMDEDFDFRVPGSPIPLSHKHHSVFDNKYGWNAEDIFDDLPHTLDGNPNLLLSKLHGDFSQLNDRELYSTSTPFTSHTRQSLNCHNSEGDSGIDTTVATSFASSCAISAGSLDSSGRSSSDPLAWSGSDLPLPKMTLDFTSESTDEHSDSALAECSVVSTSTVFSECYTVSSTGSDCHNFSDDNCDPCSFSDDLHSSDILSDPCTLEYPIVDASKRKSTTSHRTISVQSMLQHFSPKEPDRLIGRKMGLDHVDILHELQRMNIICIRLILSYLEADDLCRVCCVSRQWQILCNTDTCARIRKQAFLTVQRSFSYMKGKENHRNKRPQDDLLPEKSHRGLTIAKDALAPVQYKAEERKTSHWKHIPSKHKGNIHTEKFWQEANQLKNDESLRKCPRCQNPARTHEVQERAWCCNELCAYDFCIKCRSPFHGSKDCTSAITKKTKTDSSVGSKKSKRNLRRL